jgi:hypothetical protein
MTQYYTPLSGQRVVPSRGDTFYKNLRTDKLSGQQVVPSRLVPYGFTTAIKNKLFRPLYTAKEKWSHRQDWVVGGAHIGNRCQRLQVRRQYIAN